jgi:Holliday junction resolvasome RuvABC ATP-dependent DNA helicase subunit
MSESIAAPVERFVAELAPVLTEIARTTAPHLAGDGQSLDVAVEAFNLVAAFIECDGRVTDEELRGLIGAFGPRLPSMLGAATPDDVRAARIVEGKRAWLAKPSLLFDILVETDTRRGTAFAAKYYDRAVDLAHATCGLDGYTSTVELAAVDRFAAMLLKERARIPPPATPSAATTESEVPTKTVDELLAELDELVGLTPVKAELRLVANLVSVQHLRRDRGLKVTDTSQHLVFTGNPGTGKTTVARLLGQIFRALEVVPKGHLVESDRAGLVAGYVGQTALKVTAVFERAKGGVLLIDEAYALARGGENDFGREAIDTIVKLMEDMRDDIVVIVAGYPEEMATFIDTNPGLRSRFPKTIDFPDYSNDELAQILDGLCDKAGYTLTTDARARAHDWFVSLPRGRAFGNARLARNLFESMISHQATRLVAIDEPTDRQLMDLLAEDVVPPAEGRS